MFVTGGPSKRPSSDKHGSNASNCFWLKPLFGRSIDLLCQMPENVFFIQTNAVFKSQKQPSVARINLTKIQLKIQKSKQKTEIPIYRIKISIAQTLKMYTKNTISASRIEISTSEKPLKVDAKIAISISRIEISTSENLQKPLQKLKFRFPGCGIRLLTMMVFCDHS